MLDDLDQHVKPADAFENPRLEGAVRALQKSAKAILTAFMAFGIPIPDVEYYHHMIGQAAGLPSAKSFLRLRTFFIAKGLMQSAQTPEGPKLSLTLKGRTYAGQLYEKLAATGKIDEAIAEELAEEARAPIEDMGDDSFWVPHECAPECVAYLAAGGTEPHEPKFKASPRGE